MRHRHPCRRASPHDGRTARRSAPLIGGQRHRHTSTAKCHRQQASTAGIGGDDQSVTATARCERDRHAVIIGCHSHGGHTMVEGVIKDISRSSWHRRTGRRRGGSRNHAIRRRSPQKRHPPPGPPPRRPRSEIDQLLARSETAQLGQRRQAHTRLGFHIECGHPSGHSATGQRHANHCSDDDSGSPISFFPRSGHHIVELAIDPDDIREHANNPPCGAGRLDGRDQGIRLVAELQPSLVGAAQRPSADFSSSTRLVCSQGNKPPSESRPKCPYAAVLR